MRHFTKGEDAPERARAQVIHVTTSLNYGGVERHLELLGYEASRSEYLHYFCAIEGGGVAFQNLSGVGLQANYLAKPSKIPSPSAFFALYRLFRRLRPDIVHTHGSEANFHGLIAAWAARVPVRIAEEIGIPSHSALAKKVFRSVYKTADGVIGISRAVRSWLIESGEVPSWKAWLLYNPVKLSAPSLKLPNLEQVFRVCFVGRLEPVKNPLSLLEATARLKELGVPVELWLVGDGSQRDDIERRVKVLGIPESVKLLGYKANPLDYVSKCHLYVQPSISEGFGIALVEAMGCGVPVLASSVGGAPEIITHGQSGWLIDNPSPAPLSDAIFDIWRQRETLRRIGLAGQKAVEGRFDPVGYLRRLDELYGSLLSKKESARRD